MTRPAPEGANEHGRYCSVCTVWKTWDEFYRQARGHNGYEPRCKICRANIAKKAYENPETAAKTKARVAKWRAKQPKKARGRAPSTYRDESGKVCTKCHEYYAYCDFHKNKATTDGRTSACKNCLNKKAVEYNRLHPEKVKERSHKWYMENKEKHYEDTLRWKRENAELHRKQSREGKKQAKERQNETE